MKKLTGYEIRKMWLDFWKSKGHDIAPSASLIPFNDPTLLWINSGVASLKRFFDGREVPQNRRIANAQKAIRTNDIENVGKTARHHTFFEMLGNFSIGDYFRNEVLKWAVELLTSKEWFDLDPEKLYITYYPSDLETYNKWLEYGIKADHLIPVTSNFWEIGEGPCGPDTEIFFDRGEKYDPENLQTKLIRDDIENDRYIEIWNIVFSQFNAKEGLPRNKYPELPSKNIDTGCGLERVACIMQGANTNYDTDLFMPLINKTEQLSNVKYTGQMAFKVISDHIRSTVFALSDGATFSNEGRGYVLRRILRRALRYGQVLGIKEAFLYKLVPICIDTYKQYYTYLEEKQEIVTMQIKQEEEKFLLTLELGEKKLLDFIKNATNTAEKIISKEVAFLLYDTFGFPLELTIEVSSEYGYDVDVEGFKEELNKQKVRARNARNTMQSMNVQNEEMIKFKTPSTFVGYDVLEIDSKIIKVIKVDNSYLIVFEKTPFYAEMGGQVGDKGKILINGEEIVVENTIKLPNGQHGSLVNTECLIKEGMQARLIVDSQRRLNTMKNHSATHLLNQALREVAGNHIYQQGSFLNDSLLRFDFNNFSPLTNEQILQVEKIVQDKINDAIEVNTYEMSLEEAKKTGAQAVFNDKYGKVVRVVDMTYSKELCSGTHVKNTLDIQAFAILGIESKGSGIFRITAATSSNIISMLKEELKNVLSEIDTLKAKINDIRSEALKNNISLDVKEYSLSEIIPSYQTVINKRLELESLKEEAKTLEKTYNKLLKESNVQGIDKYLEQVQKVNGNLVLLIAEHDLDMATAKDLVDRLSDKLDNSLVIMANITQKVVFVCKNKIPTLHAGKIVQEAAAITGGSGGGRSDFATAGGKDISKVALAFSKVLEIVGK